MFYVADLKQCEEFKNAKNALSNTIEKEAQDMEEIEQKLRTQGSDLEHEINIIKTEVKQIESKMTNKMSNWEKNELGNLKKTFSESIEKMKEKIGTCRLDFFLENIF